MELETVSAILWRRLDAQGHDACRLVRLGSGWRLDGAAVFRHDDGPACLAYVVDADAEWRTREATVRGWVGGRALDIRIARTAGGVWTLGGRPVPDLDSCVDLDLGFTPATNLLSIRRMALDVGQHADVTAAWLDVPAGTLDVLHQRYERRTAHEYWYEGPRFGYRALLEVDQVGFVTRYPDLWESVGA